MLVWQKLEQLRKDGVNSHNKEQRRIAGKITKLTPISRDCVKEWAEAFADFHLNFEGPPKMDSHDVFYVLASPERDLGTRQFRAYERLEKKESDRRASKRIIEFLEPEKQEAQLKKIAAMKVTPRAFHRLLVAELSKRLLRMLRK